MANIPPKFSLFKRSNGFYYIVYDQDGRRRWKSTGGVTRSDALKALANIRPLLEPAPLLVNYAKFQEQFMAYAEV